MKSKKLYIGTIALALSIGTLAPLGNNAISSVVYASEQNNQKQNEEKNRNTEDETKKDEKQSAKSNELKELIDDASSVKESERYNKASSFEKDNYNKAIEAGKNPKAESDLQQLIDNIISAKEKLGASSFNTYEQRESLSSTIALAEKLSKSIENNSNISKDEKDKLKNAIDNAKVYEKNVNKSGEEIKSTNNTLAQNINDLISKYNLDLDNLALTNDEISKIQSSDTTNYGKAYKKLNELDEEANKYTESNEFKNIKDRNIKNNLVNRLTEAKNLFENVNSTTDQLKQAYNNLNKAYNDALVTVNSEDTQVSRLKKQIQETTASNPEGYGNAGEVAKLSYNNAKANANTIAKKENATADELQKALNNLKLAKLTLAPVKTKTLDDEQSQKSAKENLQKLVDDAKSYKKENPYKSASAENKKEYDDAITKASDLLKNTNSTNAQFDEQVKKINDAKSKLAASKLDTNNNDFEQGKTFLDSLVRNKKIVEVSSAYKDADSSKKEAYDKAISDASLILKDIADGKDIAAEKINESINKIVNALADMKYIDDIKYPSTLKELIDEAPSFRESLGYYIKNNSQKDADKALIKTYNDLIEEVSKNIDTINQDQKLAEKYVERINDVKKTIQGKMTSEELDLKYKLNKLIDDAEKVSKRPDFNKAAQQKRDDLNKALEKAKKAETNKEIEEAISYLEAALKGFEKESLEDLLALAKKVKEHEDYKDVGDTQRESLDNAIAAANNALASGNDTEKEIARTALENALDQSEIKAIADLIRSGKESKDTSKDGKETVNPKQIIEKVIANDQTLKASEKYKKAQKSLRDAYDKALLQASELINKDDVKEKDLKAASDKLIAAAHALDGDKFKTRLKELQDNFAKNKSKITDKTKRSDLEEKIKALDNENATMDDLLAVEKAYKEATAVTGSQTPVQGSTSTTTTSLPGTTTTTTPVTTTKEVPATITPGSIVRTGIKSIVGVAVVLVVALGAYALTGKSKKKDENEKTQRRNDNEIK
ncbi:hypothetical protein [Anaerococcus sp.]|uniref:hypothetical protein n=1 Tax=Anaerococcus sp. TaxID=1872515 RepID=UPI00280C1847|nr:hypothetical protein [Anaerococcus sp.]MDU3176608.1 hypothetical protein [Anaerococcus sp.]